MDVALVLFIGIELAGALIAVHWWRAAKLPFPERPTAQHIFRLVRREDRAAYCRIMRRTTAVAMRDLGRAFNKMSREIGRTLLPVLQRFNDALVTAFRK